MKAAFSKEFDKFYANVTSFNESAFPSLLNSTKMGYNLVLEWINPFIGDLLGRKDNL
jgi:hypothetical protein